MIVTLRLLAVRYTRLHRVCRVEGAAALDYWQRWMVGRRVPRLARQSRNKTLRLSLFQGIGRISPLPRIRTGGKIGRVNQGGPVET